MRVREVAITSRPVLESHILTIPRLQGEQFAGLKIYAAGLEFCADSLISSCVETDMLVLSVDFTNFTCNSILGEDS